MQSYTGVKGRTSDGKALDKTIVHQQARQMDNDALAILNNSDVMVPGSEGLADIRVVEAALKSVATGKRVEIV
ncbi:MAG: Gfo/Idh/MocA family oxidoreductase [Cellvibrionaceae bacterium]|nr:Gfo/Idh/MocA family oxidoreductase [Cellvibrionaceae bacterium]